MGKEQNHIHLENSTQKTKDWPNSDGSIYFTEPKILDWTKKSLPLKKQT
jgi:hypothetical protein